MTDIFDHIDCNPRTKIVIEAILAYDDFLPPVPNIAIVPLRELNVTKPVSWKYVLAVLSLSKKYCLLSPAEVLASHEKISRKIDIFTRPEAKLDFALAAMKPIRCDDLVLPFVFDFIKSSEQMTIGRFIIPRILGGSLKPDGLFGPHISVVCKNIQES